MLGLDSGGGSVGRLGKVPLIQDKAWICENCNTPLRQSVLLAPSPGPASVWLTWLWPEQVELGGPAADAAQCPGPPPALTVVKQKAGCAYQRGQQLQTLATELCPGLDGPMWAWRWLLGSAGRVLGWAKDRVAVCRTLAALSGRLSRHLQTGGSSEPFFSTLLVVQVGKLRPVTRNVCLSHSKC